MHIGAAEFLGELSAVPGIVLNMIGNGHLPGVVTMAAEALRPLVH
ncbi:hypothetical protein [Nostocoides veronense]|uniref:Uncharacterized protein n=1 Tax=Nostocoides veronense TaxID=330836 RepID=A0ABN2LXB7_9MICO